MKSLAEQQQAWERHRARLEREIRVAIVESDDEVRAQLEDLLYKSRIPARAFETGEQALERIEREHYALVIAGEKTKGIRGLALTRQLRVNVPDVDVVLTSAQPTVDLLTKAFDLRILDVLCKPFDDPELVTTRIKAAIKRNVDRRMRNYVLKHLRDGLEQLTPETREKTTASLDTRLSAFKSSLGAFDRVLVVEGEDTNLRNLSENLTVAGLDVEATSDLSDAIRHMSRHDVCLVVAKLEGDVDVEGVAQSLRAERPHVEMVMVTEAPTAESALTALRGAVSYYTTWPPEATAMLVLRLRDVLRRGRRDRLVDNLFLELYREANADGDQPKAFDANEDAEAFETFRQLIGLNRILPAEPQEGEERPNVVGALETILTDALEIEIPAEPSDEDAGESEDDDERRIHQRVPEQQFVRFRPEAESASTVAYVGDLSEGGIFVRTKRLLTKDSKLDVDFNAQTSTGELVAVRCKARAAWTATTAEQSPLAPGFGVKFVDPPDEVVALLKKIVAQRRGNPVPE